MKILIDGMNLALEQGTGVATYSKNLSYCVKDAGHHLSTLYGKPVWAYRDKLLREAAFFDSYISKRHLHQEIADVIRSPWSYRAVEVPNTPNVLKNHIAASLPQTDAYLNVLNLFHIAVWRAFLTGGMLNIRMPYKVDIAHWTYPIPARIVGAKNIYTIHDMVPLKLPYATLDSKSLHFRILKKLCKEADHFVTVSEASKRDIVDMLGVRDDFVTNTYQSVKIPAHLMEEDEAQRQIDLDAINIGGLKADGFYLFVGAIEPKKNLRRIIEAYLGAGVEQPLLVVGRKGWHYKADVKLMERSRNIHYLDYLPFHQLITLMRSARALIWPSLYEGFGLPVLESFLCGTPVITADASSTAEIAGDAALLVDPYDVRDIREGIRKMSDPDSEGFRRDLVAKGRAQAEQFSQEKITANLDAMYQRLAAA